MRGFLAVVVSAALFFPSFAQCPSYTKGRDSLAAFPLGSPSALPEGFVLYRVRQSRGLFRTSTRQYSPSIVSGTQSDDPYSISISPDGAWVLYLDATTGAIVVQRLDGSGRAELYLWGTRVTGFYRQSPQPGRASTKQVWHDGPAVD